MAVQDEKLTVEQLAKKLKSKYPQYMMMDDSALVSKLIEKYPQYQNVLKKKRPIRPRFGWGRWYIRCGRWWFGFFKD